VVQIEERLQVRFWLKSHNLFVFYPYPLKETAGELVSLLLVGLVPCIAFRFQIVSVFLYENVKRQRPYKRVLLTTRYALCTLNYSCYLSVATLTVLAIEHDARSRGEEARFQNNMRKA